MPFQHGHAALLTHAVIVPFVLQWLWLAVSAAAQQNKASWGKCQSGLGAAGTCCAPCTHPTHPTSCQGVVMSCSHVADIHSLGRRMIETRVGLSTPRANTHAHINKHWHQAVLMPPGVDIGCTHWQCPAAHLKSHEAVKHLHKHAPTGVHCMRP